tara:strand:+ start:172 stop:1311 length:1140 start_codon:yes stop_codon:yes gene_type:complete
MGLSKIIKKVNKAKSAVKSVKGIGAKLKSLQYDSVTDQLGAEAEQARKYLIDTRKTNNRNLADSARAAKEKPPYENTEDLMYPVSDIVPNYLCFTIMPRRNNATRDNNSVTGNKSGTNGENVFSEDAERDILLYIPDGTASDAAVTYGDADFSLTSRVMNRTVEGYKAEGFSGLLDAGGAGFDQLMKTQMTSFLNSMSGGIQNVKEGRGKNPMKEAMFEGVTFRTHSFEYEFWPKNELEAEMVRRIVYTFRTAMLPDTYGEKMFAEGSQASKDLEEIDADENYFNFPNIFKIAYEGPIANHLDGFLPSVLTKCSIDNFNGQSPVMVGEGYPISTKMSLEFQEIKLLTQEAYQQISPLGNKAIKPMDSIMEGRWANAKGE